MRRLLGVLTVALTSTACVGAAAVAARTRASREIPCSEAELRVEELGAGAYRVSGCGASITYSCDNYLSPSDVTCVHDGRTEVRDAHAPASARGTWSNTQVRDLLTSIHDGVVACLPPALDRVRLQLALSATGEVRRVGRSVLESEVNACVDATIGNARMDGSVPEARFVVLEFRSGASGAAQSIESGPAAAADEPAAAADEPAPAAPATGIAPTLDATVRAAVDARAPAILACVDETAVALQVSWSRDGHLDALLRGERQGTPEEACVRAIVQAITVAAPGSPGTIVHAVQR